MAGRERLLGQVMGFGAGAMLSAVAYQLIPASSLDRGWLVGVSFLLGAVVYFVADHIVDSRGGHNRQAIAPDNAEGSGAAIFLGALLDGLPESLVLGIALAFGGSVNVAFMAAIVASNVPQGIAGTLSLQASGSSNARVQSMWGALTLLCAVVTAVGFLLADRIPDNGVYAETFAAGAVLTMLADSMMPEAFEHGGKTVGLLTVVGFFVAGLLSRLQG